MDANTDAAGAGLDLVWGVAAMAKELNLTSRQLYHLLQRGSIRAARRTGGRWCADRKTLHREFTGSVPA
jgi:hypothetical protein